MKSLPVIAVLIFAFGLRALAQTSAVPEPQYIAIDSKDNIFVTLKYGLMKIAPDGTMTDLSKQGRDIDRAWKNLIIDSKDNLYANENAGTAIYKITVSADNKATVSLFAGQRYDYKLEGGTLAPADSTS